MLQGKIANINHNYVILNDKRFIEQSEIVNHLLPEDIVDYEITAKNTLHIVQIKSRIPQIVLGIVKKMDSNEKPVELFYPGFPKKFSPKVVFDFTNNYKIGNVIILQMNHYTCQVLQKYDSIQDRTNDKELILQLYKLNATLCNLYPIYKNKPLDPNIVFTDEYKDLSHLDTFNVDPVNSKDFDDAISLDEQNNTIFIHIVDAHEQIVPSTSVDINAFLSSFTLYLPEQIENILPKEHAEFKLSLIKNEIRKTITCEYLIDPETQNIVSYKMYKSSIVIKNRYNYEEFNEIVYKKYPKLISFYEKWKRNTLNIPHVRMSIHPETGQLTEYILETNNDVAHKIIETLMILTNITVSKHIPNQIPQRYHCKLRSEFVLENHFDNEIINAIFSIKQYRPAIYDANKSGHFGLGVDSYTHFTSPIRRYFDVIIHRLLSGVEYENLDAVLQYINKREVYIEKIVKLYENLKILSFLETQLKKVWKGYVMHKKTGGYVVLLEDLLYEIFIFDNKHNLSEKDVVNVKINGIKWHQLEIKASII